MATFSVSLLVRRNVVDSFVVDAVDSDAARACEATRSRVVGAALLLSFYRGWDVETEDVATLVLVEDEICEQPLTYRIIPDLSTVAI